MVLKCHWQSHLSIFHFSSFLARVITVDISCPYLWRIKFKSCSRNTPKMAVWSVVSPDWPPLVSLLVHHVSTYAVRLNLYSCWARIVFTERNLSQDHSTFQHHWKNGHFERLLFCFVLLKRKKWQRCKTSFFESETNSPPLKYSNRAIK